MKILRIAGLIVFLLSAAAYMGYKVYQSQSKDTMGPNIIFSNDDISVNVHATDEELLQNVTATDNKDGDVTKSLMIEKISRLTDGNKRTITYAAFDSSNHITRAQREMVYTDYVSPRFQLSEPLRYTVGDTSNLLKYMTVTDCIDGDLTDKISYDTKGVSIGQTEGEYEVVFKVTNSLGDTASLPATVEFYYPDNQNKERTPEIVLSNFLIYCKVGNKVNAKDYLKEINIGGEDYFFNSIGEDNQNKISKSDVVVASDVKQTVPGVYHIVYSYTTEDGYKGTSKLLVIMEE